MLPPEMSRTSTIPGGPCTSGKDAPTPEPPPPGELPAGPEVEDDEDDDEPEEPVLRLRGKAPAGWAPDDEASSAGRPLA
ncbi:MAG: hypothetical protein CVV27_08365 [Candidatus Melainabacteria bacterium HGW-Melainabacteria-1]|nr:MAG: hypothetical protein CVV27_08365 [Candidatus Melainabacteria bacterium HGW-Melainabacteria-1]